MIELRYLNGKKWRFQSIKFTNIKKKHFFLPVAVYFFQQKHVIKRKAYNYRNKQSIISQKIMIIHNRNSYNLRKFEADLPISFSIKNRKLLKMRCLWSTLSGVKMF